LLKPETSHQAATAAAPNGNRAVQHLLWPALLLLLAILILTVGLVAVPFTTHPFDAEKYVRSLAEGHAIARVVALVVVVPAITLLALLDRINGAAAIAALSAIAGYVLGGTATSSGP
jgi:hypothetical protein